MSGAKSLEMLDDLIFELQAATASSPQAPGQSSGAKKDEAVEKPKKEKKEKKEAPNGETKGQMPQAEKPEITLNSLDLRVGVIKEVSRHDTADRLYCEKIDIGEAEPRNIASGLVPHYTLEEMQGRRLIVVANLKPRSLVGFKSSGMVLCAAKTLADGSEKVEFLDPPADAPIGARVTAEGLTTEPLSQKQCDKQKAFENVAKELTTDEDGVGRWRGLRLMCIYKPCIAPTITGGAIR
jgi:aminoacyl tRNA synthase complex-interacting multifunctional protein 1